MEKFGELLPDWLATFVSCAEDSPVHGLWEQVRREKLKQRSSAVGGTQQVVLGEKEKPPGKNTHSGKNTSSSGAVASGKDRKKKSEEKSEKDVGKEKTSPSEKKSEKEIIRKKKSEKDRKDHSAGRTGGQKKIGPRILPEKSEKEGDSADPREDEVTDPRGNHCGKQSLIQEVRSREEKREEGSRNKREEKEKRPREDKREKNVPETNNDIKDSTDRPREKIKRPRDQGKIPPKNRPEAENLLEREEIRRRAAKKEENPVLKTRKTRRDEYSDGSRTQQTSAKCLSQRAAEETPLLRKELRSLNLPAGEEPPRVRC